MSNIALTWAQSQVTGSPISKLILFKLADQANDNGHCWPSQSTIATHCEVSRETVNRHLKKLAKAGFISIKQRVRYGEKTACVYQLRLPGCDGESQGGVTESHRGCDGESQGGVTESHIEPSVRTLNEPSYGERQPKRKPLREIPKDFGLTESLLAYCREKAPGIDPYHQFEKFKNHHQAKGSKFRDWDAAWRTWVLNAAKWEKPEEPPRRKSVNLAAALDEELGRTH